jgi:putative hydrolase of the HAD superfamily
LVIKLRRIILFDLGGTLAHYYDMSDFPFILQQAIREVQFYLDEKGLLTVTPELIAARVKQEDHESADYRSRPLEERLTRIFGLEASIATDELLMEMCKRFMAPIFARGRCYEDTLPALKGLRSRGFRTAIVSNTSWGSPAVLWRSEIKRLGLDSYMDSVVLDRDIGWRKPSERIFEFAMKTLGVPPGDCVFVGDQPKWDLLGPRAVGMEAILIDRQGTMVGVEEQLIKNLHELTLRLQESQGDEPTTQKT